MDPAAAPEAPEVPEEDGGKKDDESDYGDDDGLSWSGPWNAASEACPISA